MGQRFLEVLTADDISLGGIGVRVPHGFGMADFDRSVQLIVALPGHKPFKAQASIRHRRGGAGADCFGLEFKQVDNPDALREYVSYLLALGRHA